MASPSNAVIRKNGLSSLGFEGSKICDAEKKWDKKGLFNLDTKVYFLFSRKYIFKELTF